MTMKSNSWIDEIRKEILDAICNEWPEHFLSLIRKHDKNLEKGDLSFPSLTKKKVWSKLKTSITNESLADTTSLNIRKLETVGDVCVVFLNKRNLFENYFLQDERLNGIVKISHKTIVNFDEKNPNSSNLTSERVHSFCLALHNMNISSDLLIGVSSTNLKQQLHECSSDLQKVGVRVGAVLGENDKKDEVTEFTEFKERVYNSIEQFDDERCDSNEDGMTKEKRLSSLTNACIQFNFLGSNISNPVKIRTSNANSSFVLYNSARIKKLLTTFQEYVNDGSYSKLPEKENINFELLSETEEWELFYNFVIPFSDVLSDCLVAFSFHKLVNHLSSMSSTYSRYYNRVKILKDPLPHVIPIIHARIYLMIEVNRIYDLGFKILNIQPLNEM